VSGEERPSYNGEVKALVVARLSTGYDESVDGPVDDLIEYKNSLEDLIERVAEAVEKYRAKPSREAWRLVTDLVDEGFVVLLSEAADDRKESS
jgi:hypothetical protein